MPSQQLRYLRNVLLAAAVITLPCVGIAVGQTRPALVRPPMPQVPRGGLNPDSFYGKESFQGVSVRDSLEAIKKLEDARRMERLQDWNKAADWYQEVLEKYGQYVVPSGTDANNNIRQYTGIERPVQEQLAKWPKAGLDAYRNRYGAVAAAMLQQARPDDRETLSKVMKLYFVTEAGKTAGIRLVDLLLEGGEFAEAARVGDRLLDWHPDLVVERPKVLFRTALAYHLSGDQSKAKERAEQLKSKHAGAVGTLFGKDVVLTDALDRLLHVSPPVTVATAVGSVRYNPGVDESRSQISGATGRPGARLASIEFSPSPVRGANIGNQDTDPSGRRDTPYGPGVLPVSDGDDLFFQDGSRVYAVSLQSGVPLPGWTQSYPNTNGQYTINAVGLRSSQYTLTLTDDAVLGVLGFSERQVNFPQQLAGADRGTRLVCLDRDTGKERWVARPSRIAEENLRALDFSGSPLVVGDNVYVMGRGGKNFTAEDCYVLCFDLNTGAYKWSCFVASSNNAAAFTGQVQSSDTLSHLAYSSGRVYVLTNVGACAALDAYSGTISWLNIYPRDTALLEQGMGGWRGMGMRGGGMMIAGGSRPWEYNPVIVRDGRVFILPTDSKHLFVYDAGTGAELKRVLTQDVRQQGSSDLEPGDTPTALLAVDRNEVIMTGGKVLYCIDWTQPPTDSMLWYKSFGTAIRGRGFVTADSVYVCTATGSDRKKDTDYGGLHRILRYTSTGKPSGRVVQSYPPKRDWESGEGPGNVIVSGDQVVVASTKRVNVYADMALARKRLDDDVAAAPTEPAPRLRYAEVMFVAGDLPVAMEKLDETVQLLGGLKTLRPGPDRDHLFNDCITFANKLQKDPKGDMDAVTAAITRLYDLAADAADGDSQQVNYRMSRARYDRDFVQEGSLAAAISLYQEILTSDRLRIVPLAATDEDSGGTTQAAIVVERMIAEVKHLRPQAYEAVEKLAGDALQAAGNDPALLKKVAESYPNSNAAPNAMIAAAAAYETASDYRMAVYTLRQAYNKYGDTADKPGLLESMARNYLAMPDRPADRVDTAAARLSTIVKLGGGATALTKPLKLGGDKVLADTGVTINDALKSLQSFKADAVAARLPDFHLTPAMTDDQKAQFEKAKDDWRAAGADPAKKPKAPEAFVPPDQRITVPGVAALVKPPLELRQRNSRYDRIAAWSNGNLLLYPIGATEPVGRSADLTAPPQNLAWINDNASLLVWGPGEIVLLNGDDAKKKWRVDLKSLPKIEVVTGGQSDDAVSENPAPNPAEAPNGPIVFRQRRLNGRLIIAPQVVQVAPQVAQPAVPAVESVAQVKPVDDKVIVSTTAGQLFAIRISDGTLAWHTRLSASAPLSRVVATDDFTVAKVDEPTSTQLVAVDTLTGQIVKRFPFPNDNGGTGNSPVNFALAPDGTLVWIQQDRLCGKDLFETRKKDLNYEIIAGQEPVRGPNGVNIQVDGQIASPIYAGATNPDQLLISEGRILVVTANGSRVAVHSLETGKLLDFRPEKGGPAAEALLSTQGDGPKAVGDWSVALHLVGSKLFICSRRSGPLCYDLDKGTTLWVGGIERATEPSIQYQEPFIGQDFFVLINRPLPKANINGNPSPNIIQPHCYSRAVRDPKTGRESGLLCYNPPFRDDSGILDVQGVEGGFYYLTGDKKLHFARGARP
jgi:outer membrane protein assembly factor BamB